MSEDITQRAREALEGVTPGPWWYRDVIENRHNVVSGALWDVASCSDGGYAEGDEQLRDGYAANNAAFIAAARQLVPELVAEVERLHDLVRRGLPVGEAFKTPYAAGARAELRRLAREAGKPA